MGFLKRRFSRHERYGLSFTIGLFLVVLFCVAFAGILESILDRGLVAEVDTRIMNLVTMRRDPAGSGVLLFFTYLGNWQTIVSVGVIALVILLLLRKKRMALFLVGSVASSELVSNLFKFFVHRARPDPSLALIPATNYAFPSGHVMSAIALYGFLGYALFHTLHRRPLKLAALYGARSLIFLIGISRIYLGVHWASDVVAGWLLGFALLTIWIEFFSQRERYHPKALQPCFLPRWGIAAISLALLLIEGGYVYAYYQTHPARPVEGTFFTMIVPPSNESLQDIILSDAFPKFSETLTGKRANPVSIIVVGSKENLIAAFKSAGWFIADIPTPSTIYRLVRSAVVGQPYPNAAVSPAFLNKEPETVAFEQPTTENRVQQRHHTRFWLSGFSWQGQPIWVATASFDDSLRYVVAHSINPAIDEERDYIKASLDTTGFVENDKQIQLVPPFLGKNPVGDPFFTDGKAQIIVLRGTA